jgi:hypothetical protein
MKSILIAAGTALVLLAATTVYAQTPPTAPARPHTAKLAALPPVPQKPWEYMDANERMDWAGRQVSSQCRTALVANPQTGFWLSIARTGIVAFGVTADFVLAETQKRCAELIQTGSIQLPR